MKYFLMALMLVSSNLFAQTVLTKDEQLALVEKEAKSIRRSFYQTGHMYVTTNVEALTLETLPKALVNENLAEQRLDETELFSISQCAKATEACSLFLIALSSEYQGGYGMNRYWILLDPTSGSYKKIDQLIYTE